jgi:hypothetical protein
MDEIMFCFEEAFRPDAAKTVIGPTKPAIGRTTDRQK